MAACGGKAGLRGESGQQLVEYAIVYSLVMLPLTFAIVFTSELLWTWHSIAEFTRDGARYAATHCWQGSGENVRNYMQTHVPKMVDQQQFQEGAGIEVLYYARNAESGSLEEFACDAGECSTYCVPDVVTVRVTGYEFRHFMAFLGLPPVPAPDLRTSLPMESAGCSVETGECAP